MSRNSLVSCVLVVAFSVPVGCAPGVHPRSYEPPGEQLILHEDIAQSGASDAWEVVRRLSHMTTANTPGGEPARMHRRGRGSIVLRETPLVVVNGVHATDMQILTQIPAAEIAWMRILTGAAGTIRFGANGGAGAVIVQTVSGEEITAPGSDLH